MTPAPSSSSRPMHRQASTSERDRDRDHHHATTSSSTMTRRSSNAIVDDGGLIMKDKDRFEDESSVGKAGGVGVGVTRPKRRLSRAMSQSNASPPSSPTVGKMNGHGHGHGHAPPSSTYQALSNNLSSSLMGSSGNGGATSSTNYNMYRNQPILRLDEKSGGYAATPVQPASKPDGPPTILGIELKWISLVTLALQNAFLTIIMHYSRIRSSPNRTYSAASAVLLNELLKGSVSVLIALRKIDADLASSSSGQQPAVYSEKDPKPRSPQRSTFSVPPIFHSSRLRVLSRAIFSPDCYKLAVPAILYVVQNNLQYVAASNLDVATFQVTYQMKILTTAFFSVFMLRKRLSKAKWLSLILLAVGVGIVQIQSTSAPSHAAPPPSPGIKISHGEHQLRSEIPVPVPDDSPKVVLERVMHPFKGFMAVTAACMTSGLAGVYFEFLLKGGGGGGGGGGGSGQAPDLWIRNTQLSLFSLVPALVPILVSPSGPAGASWFEKVMGSFSNFNGWAVGTVLTQTFGGLITAVVIRYSDNIMKGFATSISIVLSFLASVALFNYPITLAFCVGSSIVLAATYMYNAPAPSNPVPRTTIAVEPGSPILQSAPILGEPERERPSRTASFANLLGLGGSSSAASSRRPSSTDLRTQFNVNGFTPAVGPGAGTAGSLHMPIHHSASAPGTPYLSSASQSGTNLYEQRGVSPLVPAGPPSRGRSPH